MSIATLLHNFFFRKNIKEGLKKEAIAHYERMIAWARSQEPSARVDYHLMYALLGESPNAHDCLLCSYYDQRCTSCPTGKQTKREGCNGTPYEEMKLAENWEQWIVAAEKELEFLKRLKF